MKKQNQELFTLIDQYDKTLNPDVDKAWSKFEKNMKPGAKVVKRNFTPWLSLAAGVAVLLGTFFYLNSSPSGKTTVYTADSQIEEFQLPDGTKVWLNENSELTYSDFEGDSREVELKGAGFFEVAKDASKQFVISTKGFDITVLGTSFNVRNYKDSENAEIEVEEGSVKVSKAGKDYILGKEDKLTITDNSVIKSDVPVENAGGWKSNSLVFDNQLLSEAILDIEQMYGVKISVRNTELLNCFLKTSHQNENIENIFEVIKLIYGCEIEEKTKNAYVLKGGSCK